jgi:hypothetical protein
MLIDTEVLEPFMFISGRSEQVLVSRSKHGTDEGFGVALEQQQLVSETGDAVELITFEFPGQEEPAHGLKPGKELEPGCAIEASNSGPPERTGKELPEVQVQNDIFRSVLLVNGRRPKLELPATRDARDNELQGKEVRGSGLLVARKSHSLKFSLVS